MSLGETSDLVELLFEIDFTQIISILLLFIPNLLTLSTILASQNEATNTVLPACVNLHRGNG